MKRILLIINAHQPDVASIEFACKIATYSKTSLTGLFVENLYFEYIAATDITGPVYIDTLRERASVKADTERAIEIFKDRCKPFGIIPKVSVDKGEPVQEAIYESRFADLLIVEPGMNFYEMQETMPSHFVREILSRVECPVLLAPEKFVAVDEIVFCYDGSASSVFAIKLFTYLLPEFEKKKTTLLEITKAPREEFNESHRKMMEWLRAHYTDVYYEAFKGEIKDELFTYFFMKEKKLIVMGAYGRSMISNLFKKSKADVLIRMVDLPLFITHH